VYKDFEKKTLQQVLRNGQITAPTVFECISARTVELCGYPALVLSGAGISYNMNGVPDIGLLNDEEVIYLTNRLTNYTPLPVIVDGGAFYGDSSSRVYLDCYRLVKAGADAIVITDAEQIDGIDRQFDKCYQSHPVSKDVFLGRIKAAVKAASGTKCQIIAKSIADLHEAVERIVAARNLGAHITCVEKARTFEDAKAINTADPGQKMWNCIDIEDGQCVVEPKDLENQGFCIIIEDYAIKAGMFGMLYYGKKTLEDGNTVFHDTHDYDGLLEPGQDYHVLFSFWKTWLPMEEKFNDLSSIMSIDHKIND